MIQNDDILFRATNILEPGSPAKEIFRVLGDGRIMKDGVELRSDADLASSLREFADLLTKQPQAKV